MEDYPGVLGKLEVSQVRDDARQVMGLGADDLIERATRHSRRPIHGTHQLQVGPRQHLLRERHAYGAHSELHYPDLLTHGQPPQH